MSHYQDFLPIIPYMKFLNAFLKYYGMVELWNYLGKIVTNNKCKYRPINLKIKKNVYLLKTKLV